MSRPPAKGRAPQRRAPVRRKPAKKRVSLLDAVMTRLPVSQRTLQRIATWTVLVAALGGAWIVASMFGIPGAVGTAIADKAGDAGFRVDQIETRGSPHMDAVTVTAIALKDQSRSMLLYDTDKARGALLQYGWVKDAQVSRRLPNIVFIRITERVPAAIWQNQGTLSLIDRDGIFIESVSLNAMPDLPLVIGPGANLQEPAYQTLMVAAPALKPRVKAATWVGNRRWNLLFDTGETMMLPEGADVAAATLRDFAQRDGTRPVLGRGYINIDLRNFPDSKNMVLRKPDGSSVRAEPTGATGKSRSTPPRDGDRSDV